MVAGEKLSERMLNFCMINRFSDFRTALVIKD